MSCASKTKRIRLTERVIAKTSGSKKQRYIQKKAFLGTMSDNARFKKGPKQASEGGYR